MELSALPDDCISHILSLTSPKDVCRSSAVSSFFNSAGQQDAVWQSFLPADCEDILHKAVSPLAFSSMKELFLKLSTPFLVNEGRMSFSLEKTTGKKCYTLSAAELSIAWGNNPLYWAWKSAPDSRFSKVVELRTICWLQIQGKINALLLSPNTTYAAYLIFKIERRAYGLDTLPSEVSVEIGGRHCAGIAYLRRCCQNETQLLKDICYSHRVDMLKSRLIITKERAPRSRSDGWMELELGEFFCIGCSEEVKMCLMEVKGEHLKGGIVIEGIEVRPKA